MIRFLLIFTLFFSALSLSAQNEPYAAMTGNSNTVSDLGGGIYQVKVTSVVCATGVYNGASVVADGTYYLIYKSQTIGNQFDLYLVTSIVSKFSSQFTVQVTAQGGAGQPPASNYADMVVVQADAFGRFPYVAGATDNLNQSIASWNNGRAIGGATTADVVTLNPALDINGNGSNETTVQAALDSLKVHGVFLNHAAAAAGGTPILGIYQLDNLNTLGYGGGLLIRRIE